MTSDSSTSVATPHLPLTFLHFTLFCSQQLYCPCAFNQISRDYAVTCDLHVT